MADTVLEISALTRRFTSGKADITVLDGLDLSVAAGERVAITGASGSGKSTLLHLAAGMDRPDHGRIQLAGTDLAELPEPQRTRYRAGRIGLVFQDFNLIDSLTVRENIELPLWLTGRKQRRDEIERLAASLGIADLLERLPDQLSGGESQRVAIARALVHRPAVVLADEPTGSLDPATASRVLALFDRAVDRHGATLIVATHSRETAALCDRRLRLDNGRLEAA